MLPAHTTSGKGEVRVQRGHYEIKLITTHSSPSPSDKNAATMRDSGSGPLLDSSQLLHLKPTAFVCSSCTLPVIQSNKVDSYRDLPSEHWEELVEAWMCHGDQKLNDDVAKHSKRGLWPSIGHALVGGSYILFEEGAMNTTNLHISSDHKVRNIILSFPQFPACRYYFAVNLPGRIRRLTLAIYTTNGCLLVMEVTLWCFFSLLSTKPPAGFCSNLI